MPFRPLHALRNSLRRRLILLGLCVVLFGAISAGLLTWRAYANERDTMGRDLRNTARAVATLIDQELESAQHLLEALAMSDALRRGDFAQFHKRASQVARGTERWIVVVDSNSQQVVNTRLPFGAPLPRSEMLPGMREAWERDGTFVTDLVISPITQLPVVAVTVPKITDDGTPYALALVFTPDALIGGVDLSQVAPGYVLTLLDRTGTIVARSPSGKKFVGQKATPDIVAAALARRARVADSVTLEGIPVLAAVAPARLGWAVALGAPYSILRASAIRLIVLGAGITALTLAILGAITWWIMRAAVCDANRLAEDTRTIGAGRIPAGHDWALAEFGSIGDALRATAVQLDAERTERNRVEASLRVTGERFRLATNSEIITLFEQDRELRYTWLFPEHPEHRHALHRTDAELSTLGEADPRVVLKREVLATGESRRGEVTVELPIGVRHYSLFVTARRDAAGRVVGVAGAALDITERRDAEHELVLAKQELLRANAGLEDKVRERTARLTELLQQMEEFTYSVSHDLRAPIRAMTSFSGVLLEDYASLLGPSGRTIIERIVRNGEKMDRLINDLLAFSRVNRESLELQPLSLGAMVLDASREIARGNAVKFVIEPELPSVLAHPTLLSQVLVNLFSNAAKFVAPGVRPLIHVSAVEHAGRVRVTVRDNGIGIRPELQSRLFRVFERLHTDQGFEGTGIGLAIVRRAVERMGGRTGAESDGTHGSLFWIELEAAAAPAARASDRTSSHQPRPVAKF